MKIASAISLFATLLTSTRAVVIPTTDTPVFYLVASSQSSANLVPLRTSGSTFRATLSGDGPIGNFFFYQGVLMTTQPPFPTTGVPANTQRALIDAVLGSTGCSPGGALVFVQGSSSNKCAKGSTFGIQSDIENSQLGAKLVFNWVGGFYACGTANDVYYKTDPSESPSGCNPIDLWTVPVSPVG